MPGSTEPSSPAGPSLGAKLAVGAGSLDGPDCSEKTGVAVPSASVDVSSGVAAGSPECAGRQLGLARGRLALVLTVHDSPEQAGRAQALGGVGRHLAAAVRTSLRFGHVRAP